MDGLIRALSGVYDGFIFVIWYLHTKIERWKDRWLFLLLLLLRQFLILISVPSTSGESREMICTIHPSQMNTCGKSYCFCYPRFHHEAKTFLMGSDAADFSLKKSALVSSFYYERINIITLSMDRLQK